MHLRIPAFLRISNFTIFACLLLASCTQNHLYVQQEWATKDFLASSHALTPDPRQEIPFEEQRLLLSWEFPKSLFEKKLTLKTTVRFWDQSEKEIWIPVERKRDALALSFPSQEKKLLTYRVQVFDAQGELVETWNHHFWTQCIDIDRSAPHRSSEEVSSQPKQASVIETP